MTRKGRKSQSRRGIIVDPKSAPLSFRLRAKSRSAPLCLLLPTRPTSLGSCWVPFSLTIFPLKRPSIGKIGSQMEPSEAGPFGRGGARERSETWPSGRGERCGLCPDDGPPIGCTPRGLRLLRPTIEVTSGSATTPRRPPTQAAKKCRIGPQVFPVPPAESPVDGAGPQRGVKTGRRITIWNHLTRSGAPFSLDSKNRSFSSREKETGFERSLSDHAAHPHPLLRATFPPGEGSVCSPSHR